jgi:hypothetical protein
MTQSPLGQVLRTAARIERRDGGGTIEAIIAAAAEYAADQTQADIYTHHAICLLAGYWNTPAAPGRPANPLKRLEVWASRCTTMQILTMLGLAAAEADWLAGDNRPAAAPSPLAQAEQAKRRRDLTGEIEAIQGGYEALTSALWHPAQAGDILHVRYEAMPSVSGGGETYVVEASEAEGGLVLRLLAADAELVGPGAFEGGVPDDPFMEAWIEAGPAALTIVRAGRVIHGRAEASR